MHDVLDPRDLVPDEAEQLLHSGYPAGTLLAAARAAAAGDDLTALGTIADQLAALERDPYWRFDEPDDDGTLQALADAAPVLAVDPAALPERLHGSWLGRCIGNTMGKPVEGMGRTEIRRYLEAADAWPQTGYVPLLNDLPAGIGQLHPSAAIATAGNFTDVPRDDDIDWTILGLWMLEQHGAALTTTDVARSWLDRLPFTQTYTAERAAYRNLVAEVPVERTATVDNPYREWIGAQIRADVFGYVRPGRPGAAARLALVDARLSHVDNGIFGELWAAALVAAALASTDVRVALATSLTVIPAGSRLTAAVQGVLDLHASGAGADEALDWVDHTLGHYNWVHTVNNAALVAIGLLWGTDFAHAVALTIAGGRDTDSSAATTGSVYGALHGRSAIPDRLVGTTHHRVRSAVRGFDRVTIDELVQRTIAVGPTLDAPART